MRSQILLVFGYENSYCFFQTPARIIWGWENSGWVKPDWKNSLKTVDWGLCVCVLACPIIIILKQLVFIEFLFYVKPITYTISFNPEDNQMRNR